MRGIRSRTVGKRPRMMREGPDDDLVLAPLTEAWETDRNPGLGFSYGMPCQRWRLEGLLALGETGVEGGDRRPRLPLGVACAARRWPTSGGGLLTDHGDPRGPPDRGRFRPAPHPIIWLEIRLLRSAPNRLRVAAVLGDLFYPVRTECHTPTRYSRAVRCVCRPELVPEIGFLVENDEQVEPQG